MKCQLGLISEKIIWLHMAQFRCTSVYSCNCSNSKIFITYCNFRYRVNQIKIRAGEWDTQTVKERFPYQERDVARMVTHPNFNAKTLANDVGLLFLSQPVEIAENINTVISITSHWLNILNWTTALILNQRIPLQICLPSHNFNMDNSKDCYATGWGKSNFGKYSHETCYFTYLLK